jgi:C1A family cysteine protease
MKFIIFQIFLIGIVLSQIPIENTIDKDDSREKIFEMFQDAPIKEQFKIFHYVFKKDYQLNSDEAIRRYRIFKENINRINEVNSKKLSYKFGINQFCDLTSEEFKNKFLLNSDIKKTQLTDTLRMLREEGFFDRYADDDEFLVKPKQEETVKPKEDEIKAYPTVNHSKYLLAPRNQGQCGSCWAFATTAVVEAAYAIKTSTLTPYLSNQQLIDCNTNGNSGCNGGNPYNGLKYAMSTGITKDSNYPYKALQNTCTNTKIKSPYKIATFNWCSNYVGGYKACSFNFVYSLLSKGPVAVGIDGSNIQLYSSGIFDEDCSEDNHAVVLVGYGVEADGKEFWLVRNSWSPNWGENGHIRVAKNDSNKFSCFVANEAILPRL